MENIAKIVETYNDGDYVTIVFFNEATKTGFYYDFRTVNLAREWNEILNDLNNLDNVSRPKPATMIIRDYNNADGSYFSNADELISYFEDNFL